jgi:G8 domain
MGELIIGNETNPFQGQAQITLYGMKQDEQIVYENAIEAGNKVLANTALIKMFGASRKSRTRLLSPVNAYTTTFTVEAGLDWRAGDEVSLPSTTMNWDDIDYAKIVSYDNVTGIATVDR